MNNQKSTKPSKILKKAIQDRVPPKTVEINFNAFEAGFSKVADEMFKEVIL